MSLIKDILSGLGEGAGNVANPIANAVASVSGLAEAILDRVVPDKAKQDERDLARDKLMQDGWLAEQVMSQQINLGQIEVNKIEAASSSLLVAGWRPAAGWTCVFGLQWAFVLSPLLDYVLATWAPDVVPPHLDISQLIALLFGMLGIAAARSYDKREGTARDRL